MADNPLLADFDLPFGAPPFDLILSEHFLPAVRVAIDGAWADMRAIADAPGPPTFENTVVAMERAGSLLARVRRIFWTLSSAHADEALRAIEAEVGAMLTRHGIAVSHDPALFSRIKAVWDAGSALDLDEAQRRLLEDAYRGFVDGGALLAGADKARFAAIGEALSNLSTQFGQNVRADVSAWALLMSDDDAAGLPASVRDATGRRAAAKGHAGRHLLTLDRGDVESALDFLDRRDLREHVWRAFTHRCDGGAHDNRAIAEEILALRHERARLLGYASHADYALADSMAKTPDAAEDLLTRIWQPALRKASEEQIILADLARADGIEVFAPWDWRYYAERLRREQLALDGARVRRHLTLDAVRGAAFDVAGRLYGLRFTARPDLPGWHPDVQAWEVVEADGAARGILYTDDFARPEKHGGAWMGSLRVQERLDRPVTAIVYLVANFAKASDGEASGLSINEARTLFHEFGHALHALLSDVVYPSQSGTAVARDFVEFPSKFLEHWILLPEILSSLGMPSDLVDAIGRADDFGQGCATVELTASALLDLAVHRSTSPEPDSTAIERAVLDHLEMPATIAPRHGLTHFTHIFDGGYAGAYYSYLWSEVLDADAFSAFPKQGNPFDRQLSSRFRREILAPGNSRDPKISFMEFRGRQSDEQPFLESRHLA